MSDAVPAGAVRTGLDRGPSGEMDELTALMSDPAFQQLEGRFGQFCPFEAVGMVRAEIRHSNYLGYILNPFRPHGFGTSILWAFLKCALIEDAMSTIEASALDDAEIRREWRNIDLLILLPKAKRIVAIELKIDASQSSDQLQRYRTIIEATWPGTEGWRYDYLFLTKHHEAPNDASWTEFKLHDLIDALSEFADASEHHASQAHEMLRSYISMMRRHHLGNKELERTARELWSKHGDALAYLMDRRPDPLQEVLDQIKEDGAAFVASISPAGVSVVADKHAKKILRYAYEDWDDLAAFRTAKDWTNTKRLMLLEIKKDETSIRAHLMMGPGTTPDRNAYIAGLAPVGSGRFISVVEEELMTLNSEPRMVYVDLVSKMADFTLRVFKEFDPVIRKVSAERTMGLSLPPKDPALSQ
ncbi:PDDEXK-like family protein [Devosia rhizoryzae]|uniref:PD-(D/E)XK nuclease family protein n=1 Tax=Devosia rhizoryzae TaxID=2774137 RepID=A0ABX7C8V7_9HYPH|nr:PD-(D/E)XK nuclease family protein [Devosia rhizoryzae]QQR39025.1 PD-(D/E)XK nuclease family protein [Devosia rhizoryzae]